MAATAGVYHRVLFSTWISPVPVPTRELLTGLHQTRECPNALQHNGFGTTREPVTRERLGKKFSKSRG